jgi:hypothetical protein
MVMPTAHRRVVARSSGVHEGSNIGRALQDIKSRMKSALCSPMFRGFLKGISATLETKPGSIARTSFD